MPPTYQEQLRHHRRMQRQRAEPHGLFQNDEAIADGALVAGLLAVILIVVVIAGGLWWWLG